ncbi:DUF2510 domain-containing protein [Aldersonia kunmingensis]|uniref:DUF2510 domain-containing protein n=1 Tax=Aldersonia kunmingensis TaxID=408066 RepID=UPI00082AA028|nr:DUF2510 domain-containing protein [Aldersonia kunmingensis]
MTQPAPGWYPDPSDPAKNIYWDGTAWAAPASASSPGTSRQKAVAIGVCVLVGIGFLMSMQSVSLLTGTGAIWTGVGVVGAGVAVAFFFGAAKWVRVVAAIVLTLTLVNAVYIENEMSNKRDELSHIFDD